jgi:ferredoxin
MIFYFTGTGNSLMIAKRLAEGLNDTLVSITAATKENQYTFVLKENENIGIVVPVYFYTIPTIVSAFLSKLNINGNKPGSVFLVLNCGGSPGYSDRSVEKALRTHSISLEYRFVITMPDNYILLYETQNKEKQTEIIDRAEKEIHTIIDTIANGKENDNPMRRGPLPALLSCIAPIFYTQGRKTKGFYVTDRCTHCGLCEKNCPSKAIRIVEGSPTWVTDQCVFCLGCLHRCPGEAIQYGKNTSKRKRYVNPYAFE